MDWREGERWFWDTLVDADSASNPFNPFGFDLRSVDDPALPGNQANLTAINNALATGTATAPVVVRLGVGTVWLRGPGAKDHANGILTNDLGRIAPGQAQYTLLCNESGGVIDDLDAPAEEDTKITFETRKANLEKIVALLKMDTDEKQVDSAKAISA